MFRNNSLVTDSYTMRVIKHLEMDMIKPALYSTLLASALFFVSCGPIDDVDPDEESSNTSESTFGIRHDKELSDYEAVGSNESPYNTSDYPDFNSVIKFCYSLDGSTNEDYIATGTVVGSQWILTAGHNFYVASEQSSPAPASGITIVVGDNPNTSSTTYEVESINFHPTWISDNEDFLNGNDICLIKVKTAITGITPAPINLALNEESIGNTTWFCGFGDYSQQSGQNANLFTNKHAIQNVLDRRVNGITTTSGSTSYNGGLLAFDFDSPEGDANTLGDNTVNSDEALLGSGTSDASATTFEGATVQGDSGGPLFMKIDGEWHVCGVLSGGASDVVDGHEDSGYGDISVFIRTSSHSAWIDSVINPSI